MEKRSKREKTQIKDKSMFGKPVVTPFALTPAKLLDKTSQKTSDGLGLGTSISSTEKSEEKTHEFKFSLGPFGLSDKASQNTRDGLDPDTSISSTENGEKKVTPVYKFLADLPKLEPPWRTVQWTDERRTALMDRISSYKPKCEEVTRAQVLLLGPVGSGKSSFISSVQSVFDGRVTNRAMVGCSTPSTSFTKKLQSFSIHGQKGEGLPRLALYDIMGLGDGDMTGLTLHDILAVIKGHTPDGHKFSPAHPLSSDIMGYVKRPTLKDKIHCVAFVVDASKILTYNKGLSTIFQQLRQYISDLGVHQVALLTHIDKICSVTAKDVAQVYKSKVIRDMMNKAGALLGMSTSYIVPVKNYSSELDLDENTDLLLLSAVDHILQYSDLYFLDNAEQTLMKI